jgi:Outer membrane protein beta-barrel domain
MKKRFLAATLIIMSFIAEAQISFGAKAGLNLSNFSGTITDRKIKPGVHIGGLVNIPIAKQFSIQPELQYSSEGSKLNTKKYNLAYINIPVMLQYNNASGFYGEVGPQLGILMAAKYDGADVKSGLNTTNIGMGFGAGYKMATGLGIGARYNLGFSNILKGNTVLKPNNIAIGLRYIFSNNKSKTG